MSTPFPKSFNIQIAENSILDVIGGRQSYLGNSFIIPWAPVSLADTNEDIIALIRNVSTNTKSMFVYHRTVFTNNITGVFSFYRNPTITANGASSLTPQNLRTGYASGNTLGTTANASVMSVYTAPTIAANGQVLETILGGTTSNSSDVLHVIDPGDSMLVTCKLITGTATSVYLTFTWFEY